MTTAGKTLHLKTASVMAGLADGVFAHADWAALKALLEGRGVRFFSGTDVTTESEVARLLWEA